ncbi:hypothetical protein AOQ84DRAFT_386102 [Glonium stellatum]|uniref:Polynucleotide 5'-hydroxyl-kinase GRC3 n=1 Tax=Glonium stellatum TaxID=574774 RepID=A0A8E2JX73_9PEZI|nr:hypothetical protein AOQ84DRAFT_386102 [Glonium stellatum]
MAEKRKASELQAATDSADSSENHQTPLSAFAAARARQHQPQASENDSRYQEAVEYNSRSARIFSNSGAISIIADPSSVALGPRSAPPASNAQSDIEYDTDIDEDPSENNGVLPDERPANRAWVLCTWRSTTTNIKSESTEHITIFLGQGETVAFVGTYEVAVLQGIVTINGAILRSHKTSPIKYRVFAPSTHAIPVVQCISSSGSEVQFLSCDYTMRSMEKLSPLYSKIWNVRKKYENGQLDREVRSFSLVTRTEDDLLKRPLAPVSILPQWQALMNTINSFGALPAVMVCGPNHSGKSTFAKFLTNRFLTEKRDTPVFFLDLDANQPEYTAHGQVSLILVKELNLGPPFTHPNPVSGLNPSKANELIWAYPVPLNGAEEYTIHFYLCVIQLFKRYEELLEKHPRSPLVINTPGWAYMAGLEVLLQTITRLRLTHVVYLSKNMTTGVKGVLKEASELSGATLYTTDSQPNPNTTRTDSNHRDMHMMSYFHCEGIQEQTGQRVYKAEPMSCMVPWQICYGEDSSTEQGFIGFMMLCNWIDPKWMKTVLNGSIISIVVTEDPALQEQYGQLPRTTKLRLPYFPKGENNYVDPPDPKTSRLVCLALLRGFDPDQKLVQLLLPPTHEDLIETLDPKKVIFVFGCCDTPAWSYLEDPHYDSYEEARERKAWKDFKPDDEDDLDIEVPEEWRMGEPDIKLPPWVAKVEELEKWGKMNMKRNVRKFQK